MDIAALVEALSTRGMELLEALASGAVTRAQLGQSSSVAGSWERLAGVYFGPTRQKKLQAAARAAGRGLPVAAIEKIEKHLRKLSPKAAVSVGELRVELCGLRGTVDEIDREAADRVWEHNRSAPDTEHRGLRAFRGGKNTDAQGMRTATLTLPAGDMARYTAHLKTTADALRAEDPSLSWEQAMADAAYQHGIGGGPTGGVAPPIPLGVMRAPDFVSHHRGEGGDTVFGLTDGTTITGKEWVEKGLSELGFFGIFDLVEGGIDLYRLSRFANDKQRILAMAENLVCPNPGCTTAAADCQFHHLTAWEHEGQTNMANLSVACRVHNGRNDDDPNAPPKHGRLERREGGIVFLPPDGGPPQNNRHPLRKLSALGLLADA
ncbi:MAG: HNH endonuclease signature motif containing protein [Corynebacterium sp.]|uniref:HNH endonuclease signature motif containing protein n=1 Tax=Corynebacterium sp. TaxID=1720 RepID=UPI0026E0A268|nr:HNH endonuclease signature motif containing protein [Corynebacterium sp.]MDO5669568.1 HNH endonuclease signature motif containing protein [Corynebacterium sp.]